MCGAGSGFAVDWRDAQSTEAKGVEVAELMASVGASTEALVLTMIVAAVACGLVAATVGHGILRPMLEARGVLPWTVRDSVGSMPLVLIGAAAIGAAASVASGWLWGVCEAIIPTALGVIAGALFLLGLLTLRLGLLALRKLP